LLRTREALERRADLLDRVVDVRSSLERLQQPLFAEAASAVRRAGIGHSVREHHERVAALELHRRGQPVAVVERTQERPAAAHRLGAAAADQQWKRVPGRHHARVAALGAQQHDRGRAERHLAALAQVLVEARKSHRRRADQAPRGAQRVARHRGQRRRLRPTPHDVADHRHPAGRRREDVVEVAADVDLPGRRHVQAADRPARHVGETWWEETALQALGHLAELGVQPGVLECGSGTAAELLSEAEVGLAEAAARLRADQRDGADGPLPGGHRDDQDRAHPELADQLALLGVERRGLQHLVGDLRDQLRAAGADHLRDALGVVEPCRVALLVAPGPLDHGRIAVEDGHRLERAGTENRDRAPVRELGNQQLGDSLQCLLVVERGRKHPARVGQQTLALLLALGLGDVLDDVDGQRDLAIRAHHRRRLGQPPARLARRAVDGSDHERLDLLAREHAAAGQLVHAQRRAVLVVGVEALEELHRGCVQQVLDAGGAEEAGGGLVREHETAASVLHRDGFREVREDRLQTVLGREELL
jgi:hypothetical protein